jgi:hypothetical protein
VTSGDKYWVQADLKVFFLRALKANAGLKVSFQRGYLPPVYNFNKAFNFGLVIESSDNDTSGAMRIH